MVNRGNDAGATSRPARKPFAEPGLRVYTASSEIPDTFPGAAYFRASGFRTYHDVFGMTNADLAAAEQVVGSEVIRNIATLQRPW